MSDNNLNKNKKKKTELDLLIGELKKNFNNKVSLDEADYTKVLEILNLNKTKNEINKMLNEIEKSSKKIDVTSAYNSIHSAIKKEFDLIINQVSEIEKIQTKDNIQDNLQENFNN